MVAPRSAAGCAPAGPPDVDAASGENKPESATPAYVSASTSHRCAALWLWLLPPPLPGFADTEHGHSHGLVDRSILRSRTGVRAVLISLAVLRRRARDVSPTVLGVDDARES